MKIGHKTKIFTAVFRVHSWPKVCLLGLKKEKYLMKQTLKEALKLLICRQMSFFKKRVRMKWATTSITSIS